MNETCEHKDFFTYASIGRIGEMPTDGRSEEELDPHSFVAEVSIECTECHQKFGFKGVGGGYNFDEPTQGVDGLAVNLPLRTPAEMQMAGPLAGMDVESRRTARGMRVEIRAENEGTETALAEAVRARTNGWLSAYKEARANGMDDPNAQMHADWLLAQEFEGGSDGTP